MIIKKSINIIVNILSTFLSLLIPKSKKIWIFGSWFGETFSDNSKYLYLYCNKNKEYLGLNKVIWITNNDKIHKELKMNNFIVYKKWSIESIWYHLRAEKHFICQTPNDINPYFSIFAKRIQLWHGIGLKRLSKLEKIPNTKSIKYKILYFIKYISSPGLWYNYIFLTPSKFATNNIFGISFRLWENKKIKSNYPRNIYLSDDELDKYYLDDELLNILNLIDENKKGDIDKVIIYLPTYRGNSSVKNKNTSKYPFNIKCEKEFLFFENFLKENRLLLINKSHFVSESMNINYCKNIINLNSEIDIYPMLKKVDMLITDYSSVYVDFLIINKPIIFYTYDFDEYIKKDKGFLLNYSKFTPGNKVFNIEELMNSIKMNFIKDNYIYERNYIKSIYLEDSVDDTFEIFIKKVKEI